MGLTKEEIKAILDNRFDAAISGSETIRSEQEKALKQYYLMPNGKERDGYSKVQSSNTRDAVEWMLPILMDMYLQPESPIIFKPNRGESAEQAKAETAYTNNIIYTQNNGPMLLASWFKSALILKNGYVKCFWEKSEEKEEEEYKGLSMQQYEGLLADDSVEVKKVEEYELLTPEGVPVLAFDVEAVRTEDTSQVRIINVASDHVVVDPNHDEVSLKNCNYCCHFETRTKGDLIDDGYKRDVVESISAEGHSDRGDTLDSIRSADGYRPNTNTSDWTQDEVVVFEHYIRMDKDGKGKSELWKITTAGDTVLDEEKIDRPPLVAITPFIVPNSHIGLSLADMTAEGQEVSTAVMRQVLDNLNHVNNPMKAINTTLVHDAQQAAQQKLGGIILTKGSGAVEPVTVPFMAAQSLNVMEYMERQEEKRTGLSRESVGLNSEALAQSTNYVGAMALNQSQLKARFIASMFAQTGVKELVLFVRELVIKYMDREDIAEISGQYIDVDPRSWTKNRQTTVRVGLGVVQKNEKIAAINQIAALQEKVLAMQEGINGPFVTMENIYATLSDYEEMTGTSSVGRYFSNPEGWQPPPEKEQPIDEALQIEEAKVATNAQKDAAEIQIKREQLKLEWAKLELDKERVAVSAAEAGLKAGRELV